MHWAKANAAWYLHPSFTQACNTLPDCGVNQGDRPATWPKSLITWTGESACERDE